MSELVHKIIGIVPVLAMALARFSIAAPANIFPYQPDVPVELEKSI